MTLRKWVFEWLKTYKRIMIKPSTYDSYLQYATNVNCDVELTELKQSDIQKIINDMICSGKQLSTVKHMLTLVRQSLRKARALGMIKNLSMLDELELPNGRPKAVRPFSAEQIELILSNCQKSFYGDFYRALLYSGCRVGELIALRWSDVDFFSRELHIRYTDYQGTLQEVKTANGRRILPLYGELESLIRNRYRSKASNRVFTNTLGQPVKYRTALENWHLFAKSIGIYESVGFHAFRHTFAHVALRSGVPVKVVSAWLGHADVVITLRIYDSVDNEDFKKAVELLDENFSLKKQRPLKSVGK